MSEAKTLGDLKKSGVAVLSVRDEMRKNLGASSGKRQNGFCRASSATTKPSYRKSKTRFFPATTWFSSASAAKASRASFAASTQPARRTHSHRRRAARSTIIRTNRFAAPAAKKPPELGDALPMQWVDRDHRYGEKLATPDVSIADLVGEIDPIKVAEGRYLADEETIHYGLVPRTNRGVFAINELPDLTEKVQVGLFNLMEEKDVQIKGYKIRLPLDVVIVASANPEDYTSRGRIITPLKDRFDVQIRTHYPKNIDDELGIMEQEATPTNQRSSQVEVPRFMKEILGHLTFEARKSNEINQSSGVSVRVTINNYESLISNAEKRTLRCKENDIVPRVSDLHSILASTNGKIEMEYVGEDKKENELVEKLLNRSIIKVFDQYFSLNSLQKIVEYFNSGWGIEVSDQMASKDYLEGRQANPRTKGSDPNPRHSRSAELMASATEFVLEGLHLHQKLNKEIEGGRAHYGK